MYVKFEYLLVLCIFNTVLSSPKNIGNTFFIKDGNLFVREIEPDVPELPDTDYVYNTSIVLERLETGDSSVTFDELNTFREGLIQYYLSRIYDYEYEEEKERVSTNIPDLSETYCLPNVKVLATPTGTSAPKPAQPVKIFLHHVKVYGFPSFKKKNDNHSNIAYGKLEADPYLRNYTGTFNSTSDTVIFTGKFDISGETYVFVYETTDNKYTSEHLRVRNEDGRFKSKTIKDRFEIGDERFMHSYERSLDNFDGVNDTLYTTLTMVMKQIYLPRLSILTDPRVRSKFVEVENTSFGALYRKKIFDLLMNSAISHLNLTVVNGTSLGVLYHLKPLSFKSVNPDNRKGSTEIIFEDLSATGLLNYTSYELSKSGIRNENSSLIKFDDVVVVKYADTGEKGAYINFSSQEGQHDKRRIDRKYRIESLELRVVYDVPDKPNKYTHLLKLLENSGAIDQNNFYFIMNFKLKNFNLYYEFVVRHIEHEMITSMISVIFP